MKTLVLLLLSSILFSSSGAFGQKSSSAMTDLDRQHISAIFNVNPDYVWQKSDTRELKKIPREKYESSYIDQNNVIQWKAVGPREHDVVRGYKDKGTFILFKNESTGAYLRPTQQQNQSQYTAQNTKQRSEKPKRSPEEQAQRADQIKNIGGTILQIGSQVLMGRGSFGGVIGAGADSGLGGGRVIATSGPGMVF